MADPPDNLTATFDGVDPGCVKLNWSAPGVAPASYAVVSHPGLTVRSTKATNLTVCGLEAGTNYSFDVLSVAADGTKSAPATMAHVTVERTKPASTWVVTSIATVALLAIAGIATFFEVDKHHTGHSLAYACWVVAAGLALLTVVGGKHGFWGVVIGADNRVSTSYVTTAMWTVLVAFALAYFTARTWFYHEKYLFDGFLPDAKPPMQSQGTVWDQYLILLGGPFAALVVARGVISTKVQNQTVQKTIADDGTASLKQTLTDDSANVDLVDSQYFLFNIVALGYVIIGLASKNQLPAIPAGLLALTSTSAATYTVNKAVQNTAPVVTGVVPSSFRPGDQIVISGNNFMPAGAQQVPTVTIGGKQALVDAGATAGRITAIAPPGAPPGPQDLVVTTAARASSNPRTVEILQDSPQILAVDPPTPTIGQEMKIRGVGFTSALDATPACSVIIQGTAPLSAIPIAVSAGLEEVAVVVPLNTPAAGPANVAVRTPHLTTSPYVPVSFRNP